MRLNSTTISPPSAHAAMGARQMLLLTHIVRMLVPNPATSLIVEMCRLPDALAKFVAVAHAMMT